MNCRFFPSRVFIVIALAALVAALPSLQAQVLYGTILGNVTDPSHGAVPGANVKIVNKGTSQEWTLTTNEVGGFSMSTVPPGTYDVTISSAGFQTATREDVIVAANNAVRVDLTLAVGAISETVRVHAETATLQTDSSDVRQEIRAEEFQNIPVPFTRNYQSLLI